jgi:hypothetical protein
MRPNYTAGALLSARDLNDEQSYRVDRFRRHDRFAHGTGIVCGLRVFAAPERRTPWTIEVCPGYAVGPCGDEIEVPSRVKVDIRDFLWSRPILNGVAARGAFVGLRYSGDEDHAAGAVGCGCGCGCATHHGESATHLHDGYAIEIVWSFDLTGIVFDLCKGDPAPCPPTPSSPYVILAAVRLPVSESTPLSDLDIIA